MYFPSGFFYIAPLQDDNVGIEQGCDEPVEYEWILLGPSMVIFISIYFVKF